ncbi:MAG TPA: hypothetical protein VF798_14815, partial [Burkholderiaceae bacterium]
RAAYDRALQHADGSLAVAIDDKDQTASFAAPKADLGRPRPAEPAARSAASSRPALPDLALDQELDAMLELDLRLETPEEFQKQRSEPWPRGPRPVTAYQTRQKLKSAPAWPTEGLGPGRAARQADMLEAVRRLCTELMQLDAAQRAAAFAAAVRENAWDSLEARGTFEAAAVHHVGGNCARYYPLVEILQHHFHWDGRGRAQLDSRPIDADIASMQRRARAYAARDSGPEEDPQSKAPAEKAERASFGASFGISPLAAGAWLALVAGTVWLYFGYLS